MIAELTRVIDDPSWRDVREHAHERAATVGD